MTSKYAHHPATRIKKPGGGSAEIDKELVPLIRKLWSHDFDTVTCCQDVGESAGSVSERARALWSGYALIELGIPDTLRLLDMIVYMPFFAERLHWAHPEAWSVSIPVLAGRADAYDADVMPWAQIKFPKGQVKVLTDYLTGG